MSACSDQERPLSVLPPILNMEVGEQYQLSLSEPVPAQWHSSDTAVAEVSDGLVIARSVGSATVSATSGRRCAECQVLVENASSGGDADFAWLSSRYLTLEKGEEADLRVSAPASATLVWLSTDSTKVSVDANGHVRAIAPGHAEIEVYCGSRRLTAYVAVQHHWSEYELVWEEPFDGNSLNRSVWNVEINGNGGGNQELQYYTDRQENLRVEDGHLVIEARKEAYGGRSYTSARINTLGRREFLYGRIEARISFPSGGGTWPAFWMMGGNWSEIGWPGCGELDIIEHIGNKPLMLSYAYHTVMQNGMKGTHWSTTFDREGVEEQYHIYGIEWLEEEHHGCDRIVFTYDGEPMATVQEDLLHIDDYCYWPFRRDCFLILNLAIGGNMGGQVDNTIFRQPVQMLVDWVRVYQRHEIE